MRATGDREGGHAPHEGLRVLARLATGLRHRQQLARQLQAVFLGRRSHDGGQGAHGTASALSSCGSVKTK
jgi:hypothetical protein